MWANDGDADKQTCTLQEGLDAIPEYLKSVDMSLSPKKTKCTLFSQSSRDV
ncbi:hypothetical protein IscW_ISCW006443 [Ixodes scapularis]|uniref:Uncharacterized protein n=1 Tax=Ixodes scapularis TaxID=6945 RepID=B7PKB3_IXOSC|nr:hypothetical protein IscW_ISCW006443 [Ixodes scapularis]|eukprot:XP_002399441.1 hypothetical protein IscW_ISCW006443 [Ixodes scapularis]